MFNSEIKAAARTFYREKVYAIINLSGLSLAIACSLILGLYLKSELTYDKHNERYKEIYRVVGQYITSGNTARYAVTPVPLGPMLKDDYPEVKDFVRIKAPGKYLIRYEDKAFFWDRVCLVDQNIFDIFTHEIIYGDPETALKDQASAAVSESFAKKKELLTDSRIMVITTCQFVVGTGIGSVLHSEVENEDGSTGKIILKNEEVGKDFFEVMGIEMVSGRDFSKRLITDVGTMFMVNEAMVRKIGWKNPLGKTIQMGGMRGRVIGVFKDYNAESLHKPVEPLVLRPARDDYSNIPPQYREAIQKIMILHISDNDVRQTLEFLQNKFAVYDAKYPFEYRFLDDVIEEQYQSESYLMEMTGIFSGICIFISCLGLYGLAAITTEQRSREIGIRKVLGASAAQIIVMLARKILWLVLGGSVVASMIAYYAMDEWLTGFAYRTGINPLVFIMSAAVVIAVAFATIALQSYRTATANPADMVHYE